MVVTGWAFLVRNTIQLDVTCCFFPQKTKVNTISYNLQPLICTIKIDEEQLNFFCLNTNEIRSKSAALNFHEKNLVDLGEKTRLKNRLQTPRGHEIHEMYPLHHLCASGVVTLLLETAGGSHPPRNEQTKWNKTPEISLKEGRWWRCVTVYLYPPVLWCLCGAISHPESCQDHVFLKWQDV